MALSLMVEGMETGGGKPARERWQRTGGEELVLRTLRLAGLDGTWIVQLTQQVKAHASTPRFSVKVLDAQRGVKVKTRPGGNDSCIEGYLRRKDGKTDEAVIDALEAAIDGPEEQTNGHVEVAKNVLAKVAPEPSLPPLVAKVSTLDDVLRSTRELSAVRKQIAETESDLAQLWEKEKRIVASLDTKPLEDALALIRQAQGGSK